MDDKPNSEEGPALDLVHRLLALDAEVEQIALQVQSLPSNVLYLRRLRDAASEGSAAIRLEIAEAIEAAWFLVGGHALASQFPDGAPAPELPSPRQVFYLVKLARLGRE